MHQSKKLYSYSKDRYLVMTQTYQTPISYDLVRESDTFQEVEDVQGSDVVLISYANDNYHLNVPHIFDEKTCEYKEQKLAFQDLEDFNAWFMIEYDEEENIVHLKHFNNERYVSIVNGDGINDDYAELVEDRGEESAIIFEPVNSDNNNVSEFTSETVFKIRAFNQGNDLKDNYLRFSNTEDRENIRNDDKSTELDTDIETIPLVVKESDPINKFDTFTLKFPSDDSYRELIFCKDTSLELTNIYNNLRDADDLEESLELYTSQLSDTFLKTYKFVTNDLEGRTNADYDIDEIVDTRQDMVAKAGILNQIFEFLQI